MSSSSAEEKEAKRQEALRAFIRELTKINETPLQVPPCPARRAPLVLAEQIIMAAQGSYPACADANIYGYGLALATQKVAELTPYIDELGEAIAAEIKSGHLRLTSTTPTAADRRLGRVGVRFEVQYVG